MRTRDYTFIYSSPCVEALKALIEELSLLFDPTLSIDDMFYYGVFCKEETYANYQHWDEAPEKLEIPYELTNICSTPDDRANYVYQVIEDVMMNGADKPDWMIYVEMEETCNEYEQAPSTFLYLIAKDAKYQVLAEKLIDFLYSPNLMTTLAKTQE